MRLQRLCLRLIHRPFPAPVMRPAVRCQSAIKKTPLSRGVCIAAPGSMPSGRRRRPHAAATDLRHDFGDEVLLLLLDAGADFEALEAQHARAGAP